MKKGWLDDFMRWFFNASPFWVDERKIWRPDEADYAKVPVQAGDRHSQSSAHRRGGNSRSIRS